MFGTDAPLGCFGGELAEEIGAKEAYEMTLSRAKTAIKQEFGDKGDEIIQKLFYDNAKNLFFKENAEAEAIQNMKTAAKKQAKTGLKSTGLLALVLLIAAGTFGAIILKKPKGAGQNTQQINKTA